MFTRRQIIMQGVKSGIVLGLMLNLTFSGETQAKNDVYWVDENKGKKGHAVAPKEIVKEKSPQQPHKRKVSERILITNVQRSLAKRGYRPGPIDGILGRKTVKAIHSFQRDNKLPANGSLTPKTLKRLGL